MVRSGLLPPPPEVMEGVELKVQYVNPVAIAQRTMELNALGQLIQFHMPLAQIDPTTIKRLNVSRISELSAEILNVPPSAIHTNEEMAELVEAERKAQEEQQMMEAENQRADSAQKMSAAELNMAQAEAA